MMPNHNITISVITVVKNDKIGFQKTMNSFRNQTSKNFELVVVDGLSTDGTLEIISENKDIINKLISEYDDGLYYAMNKGLNLASGDFAIFINSGDVFVTADVIDKFINSIENKNTLYYGNTILYFHNKFSLAPKKHHQSVFFPKSFYAKYSYNAEKYKVTAEGDYIFRASTLFPEKHIPIDMVLSKIEGFRVSQFKTLKGLHLMYNEIISSIKEHKGKVSTSEKVVYLIKSFTKYFGFKIGGISLVAKILLNSYPNKPKGIENLIALKS